MEMEILGYVLVAIATVISFASSIHKMSKPINNLLIAVQELKDCIKSLKEMNTTQNERIAKHGQEIDSLKLKVETLETKMDMYHK